MPSWSGLFRIIRRRLVLGLIFALSLTYCAFSLLRNEKKIGNLENDIDDMDTMVINDNNDDLMSDYDALPEQLKVSGKPPLWQMGVGDQAGNDNPQNIDLNNLNENETNTRPCRNSIQGKVLIVDEQGIVCARKDVLPNGCCSIQQKETTKSDDALSIIKRERYSCKTCNVQGCCAIYEYCVSCCLNPGKQIKGRKDILLNLHRDSHKAQKDDDVVRRRLRNLDRFQVCLAACRTSSASVRHENTYKDPHSKHCYMLQPPYAHTRQRRDSDSLNNNGDNPAVVVTSFSVMPSLTLLPTPNLRACYPRESKTGECVIQTTSNLRLSEKYYEIQSRTYYTVFHCLQVGANTAYERRLVSKNVFVVHFDAFYVLLHVFQYLVADCFLDSIAYLGIDRESSSYPNIISSFGREHAFIRGLF